TVGRARRARAVARLRIVAVIGRRAADEGPAGAGEAIRRTRCTAPRAVLGGIADTGRRPADRACRLEGVGWTGGRRAGAVLRDVTDARRRAADRACRLEGIRRTGPARPVARLGDVARARRPPAHGAGIAGRVLTRIVRSVTRVGGAGIPVIRTWRTRRRLVVGRARRRGPRAVLRRIALASRRPADHGRRLEVVGRARRARSVARLVHVARPRRGTADRSGVPRRVLTRSVRPVASVGRADVAVVRARGAGRRLVVRRTRGARPGAVLRRVALPARRPADYGRWRERVGGTRRGRAVAGLIEVARARRGATDRTSVRGRMLAIVARAVAHIRGARRAVVGAERAGRLLGVGRTGLSREPATGLCDVTLTRRGAAREGVRQHDVRRTRGAHARA